MPKRMIRIKQQQIPVVTKLKLNQFLKESHELLKRQKDWLNQSSNTYAVQYNSQLSVIYHRLIHLVTSLSTILKVSKTMTTTVFTSRHLCSKRRIVHIQKA